MNSSSNAVSGKPYGSKTVGTDDFRHLAEALPLIVWTSDPNGVVDYFSPQLGDLTGISVEDADYLDWLRLVHPDDLDVVKEKWNHALLTGEEYGHELRIRSADGTYLWFFSRAVPVSSPDGKIAKWYGTTTNIDVMKKAELSLKRAAEEKDKFIAVLGHELRNPLSAVSNSYHTLVHNALSDQSRGKVLDVLGRQIEQLKRLVDDVLDVSRLTSGKLRLIYTKVEANQLLRNCAEDYRHMCEDNEITLNLELADEPVWAEADSVRLSQCIGNVLSNAIKFTRSGGRIVISNSINAETKRVEISIADNGVGMTKRELDTIFQPFSQGRSSGRLSREGLGLGLAITQEIIEQHEGDIAVFSDGKGKGTVFTLSIPGCDAPGATEENKKTEDTDSKGLNVLLVDDDESVSSTLKLFLELEGHAVTTVSCGRTAFAALDKGLPDLIFCDLTLPGSVKGWDIARRVKASYPMEEMPYLVALSGHADEHHVEKSIQSGFDEHVSKPPSPEQLRSAIRRAGV